MLYFGCSYFLGMEASRNTCNDEIKKGNTYSLAHTERDYNTTHKNSSCYGTLLNKIPLKTLLVDGA